MRKISYTMRFHTRTFLCEHIGLLHMGLYIMTKGPFTRCGSGNVGVGVFHCVAAESVHTRVLHAAAATAVIAANFVCFAPFTILENSMWICFDV